MKYFELDKYHHLCLDGIREITIEDWSRFGKYNLMVFYEQHYVMIRFNTLEEAEKIYKKILEEINQWKNYS